MSSEEAVIAELIKLAEAHEAKAFMLRQAAALVAGENPGPIDNLPSFRIGPTVPVISNRSPAATGQDYTDVIRGRAGFEWEPESLKVAMNAAGFTSVNFESARTMLYRMEKRGVVRKSARGRWRAVLDEGLAPPTHPGQEA